MDTYIYIYVKLHTQWLQAVREQQQCSKRILRKIIKDSVRAPAFYNTYDLKRGEETKQKDRRAKKKTERLRRGDGSKRKGKEQRKL